MKKWPYDQKVLTKHDIELYVKDPDWQALRLSLKGMSTEDKLDQLDKWLTFNFFTHKSKVQVQNYINALRRGGQLNTDNEVVR